MNRDIRYWHLHTLALFINVLLSTALNCLATPKGATVIDNANKLLKSGQVQEATKLLKAEIAKSPNDPDLHAHLGCILSEFNIELQTALKEETIAIQLNPKLRCAYECRGHILVALNRYGEAREDFIKVASLTKHRACKCGMRHKTATLEMQTRPVQRSGSTKKSETHR